MINIRKNNETPIAVFTCSVYAPSEKLTEGGSSDPESLFGEVSQQAKSQIEEHLSTLPEAYSDWNLRTEVTQIA